MALLEHETALSLFPDWTRFVVALQVPGRHRTTQEISVGDAWYLVTIEYLPALDCVRVYGTEITSRKAAEAARDEEREQLRESEQRFRALFETMREGVEHLTAVRDEEGRAVDWRYLSANPAFRLLVGMDQDPIGKTMVEVFPGLREANQSCSTSTAGLQTRAGRRPLRP